MKRLFLPLFFAVLFPYCATGADEKMKPTEAVQLTTAEVEDVTIRNGTIHGKVVNKSSRPISDIRLLIRHVWLWDDEYDPGRDIYSTSNYVPVEGTIAPGQSKEFQFTPSLPSVPNGHFETKVIVGEYRTRAMQN